MAVPITEYIAVDAPATGATMTTATSRLQYAIPTESSSQLQLREVEDGTVRLTFGVRPMWVYALAIAAHAVAALVVLSEALFMTRVIAMVVRITPANLSAKDISLGGVLLSENVFMFGIAGFGAAGALLQWYRLHRWGRMPRTLAATRSGLTHSQMGAFGPRHHFLPAEQIQSIELLRLTDLFSESRNLALLRIQQRKKWFRRSYRLKSTDPQLPTQIAERLAATLGCPLRL